MARKVALGDVLMCTPVLREIRLRNPGCKIHFYTSAPFIPLIDGLPFVDEVKSIEFCPNEAIWLKYEASIPPSRHIARIFGDCVGVHVRDVRPTCVLDRSLAENYREAWRRQRKPVAVVNRTAGPYTPNKNWPEAYWDSFIKELCRTFLVVEIGNVVNEPMRYDASYVSLCGRTSLKELAAVMSAADVHIGPISGPVHVAAAVGTRSVVIYGGYEHPSCSSYDGNMNLYQPLRCSPCWRRDPCPIGKECLHEIRPSDVLNAVYKTVYPNRLHSAQG